MKNHKKTIDSIVSDLISEINKKFQDSEDESLKSIEISGLKFREVSGDKQQFLCCKIVKGEVVCKFQNTPCS